MSIISEIEAAQKREVSESMLVIPFVFTTELRKESVPEYRFLRELF